MPSEAERQPALPSTPDAQPANVRLVPVATSAFPPPTAEGSLLKPTLPSVTVIVPAEPVFKSPTAAADAAVPNDATASHKTSRNPTTRPRIPVFKTFLADDRGSWGGR